MRRSLDRIALTLAALVAWALLARLLGPFALASPLATATRAGELLRSTGFWTAVAATGKAFLLAVLISWAGGLALGLALGFRRRATEIADPLVGALYSIPKITLYPIILLIFGLGLSAKVAFGAIHGIFPVLIFAMGGVRNVNPGWLKVGRALGLSPGAVVATILLPAALPEILTGLRIGFASAFLGTLVGELFASDAGIGFVLMRSIGNGDIRTVMALTALIFAAAVLANGGLGWVERRLEAGRA